MIAPFFGGILIDRFGVIGGVRIALAISIVLSGATIFVQREIVDEPKAEAAPPDRWNFFRSLRDFTATLCIIPASYFGDRYGREPFVIATFIMFTLFPISLILSRSFSVLLVAFAIRGLKEFGDTSRKALIIGYCDPARCGQMVGAYYLVRDVIVSFGAIVGAYLWALGAELNLLVAAGLGIMGTIFYIKTIRDQRLDDLEDIKEEISRRRFEQK